MELVLPDGHEASPDLAVLRRGLALRNLRTLQPASPPWMLRALAALARSREPEFVAALADPAVTVLLATGRAEAAVATVGVELARLRALGAAPHALRAAGRISNLTAGLVVDASAGLAVADGLVRTAGGTLPCPPVADGDYPAIVDGIRFAVGFDPNPNATDETHPEKSGNTLDLGGVPTSEWLDALRRAFASVDACLPAIGAEMRLLLRLIIPVGVDAVRHLSASFREYVGAIYLSLHPDPATMAEALVHEFQHNKLNLLRTAYPVLHNREDELVRSPVRPDLRPLMGVLLAAHAFVPVAELHRRLLESEGGSRDPGYLRRRLADVVAKNDEALRTLDDKARPDAAGALLMARMRDLHAGHLALGLSLPHDVEHVS